MTFFESLLALLFAAIVLLQLARRIGLPYPGLLALAGVAVAFVPGAPTIGLDADTALALFIAPVLLDAAFDFPFRAASTLWRPLVVLAGGAVVATTAVVAVLGWWLAGLPPAAAIALGAIVAPPDAAAAVAVLGTVALPRRTVGVLKGESLFNDAVALLLFEGALTVQAQGGLSVGTAAELAIAAPGGIVLGIAVGMVIVRLNRFVANTLGGNLLQFLNAFLVWIVAAHLHLSSVLAVVACAMTVARSQESTGSPRMRVHSFAVWATVVFLLNVLAFLLMGLQARAIVGRLPADRLWSTVEIAGLIVLAIVATRFAVSLTWNRLATRFPRLRGDLPAPTIGQSIVVAWSGMRGLVTLATAFALPLAFPQRDVVGLIAFGVVLATLIVQGLTLGPLIRRLAVDRIEDPESDLADARRRLASVGLETIERAADDHDLALGDLYRLKLAPRDDAGTARLAAHRRLGLAVVAAQRDALAALRDEERVDIDTFYLLQEEIDWRELTLLPESERRIDEI